MAHSAAQGRDHPGDAAAAELLPDLVHQDDAGAFTDPGGDLDRLKAAAAQQGVTIEKILLTHGHIDHCGSAKILADELGVKIEGPHEADRFWISRLEDDGRAYGITRQDRSNPTAGWSMAIR